MTTLPAVRGLFETHLTVRDLERSIAFYRDVVGLALAHRVPERNAAFLWIGGAGRGMLGLWSIGTSPLTQRLHFSVAMALDDLLAAPGRLRAAGVAPRDGDEPVVIGWMPAASVFFDDPDGHSVELICMLPGRAAARRAVDAVQPVASGPLTAVAGGECYTTAWPC